MREYDNIFQDLYVSLQQAEAIAKGEMQPANVARYDCQTQKKEGPDVILAKSQNQGSGRD